MSIKVSELTKVRETKDKKVVSLTSRILKFLNRHKDTAYTNKEIARYIKRKSTLTLVRLNRLVKNGTIKKVREYYYVEKEANSNTSKGTNKVTSKKVRDRRTNI